MNYTIKAFVGTMLLFCFVTCTYDELPNPNPEIENYTYNHASTTLKWTAYKYTTMIGVSGTFHEIEVNNCIPATTARKATQDMFFSINTESIDSGSEFRDNNILEYFFDQLEEGSTISGKVSRFEGESDEGVIYISLTINNIEREIPFNYNVKGTIMCLEGDFSLADFAAIDALDYMQNCCREMHTGTDGVHLLWPDIRIEISTDLE